MLLYGITLYTCTKEKMDEADIPMKDRDVIVKAHTYLEILYKRYMKHVVGWKKGSETRINQQFLLSKMHECVLIFCMQNLHLHDLTDNQTLDVSSAKMN